MDQKLKAKLKLVLTNSIKDFFLRKLQNGVSSTNILDTLFPKERRIRSLIGGLETSMGTTVWEAIAKELATNNGFEVITDKQFLMPNPFPKELRDIIESLLHSRENGISLSTEHCIKEIREVCKRIDCSGSNFVSPSSGNGIDVYLKKDGIEYVFDMKSAQSNVGDFKRYARQLLYWYGYRLCKDPQAELRARIAFTFNPFSKSFYDVQRTKISTHLDPKYDIFVENEFWDFCSGIVNTSATFHSLFEELREEKFNEQFHNIFYENINN